MTILPIPSPPVAWEESLVKAGGRHLGRGVALLLHGGNCHGDQDDQEGGVGVHDDDDLLLVARRSEHR